MRERTNDTHGQVWHCETDRQRPDCAAIGSICAGQESLPVAGLWSVVQVRARLSRLRPPCPSQKQADVGRHGREHASFMQQSPSCQRASIWRGRKAMPTKGKEIMRVWVVEIRYHYGKIWHPCPGKFSTIKRHMMIERDKCNSMSPSGEYRVREYVRKERP